MPCSVLAESGLESLCHTCVAVLTLLRMGRPKPIRGNGGVEREADFGSPSAPSENELKDALRVANYFISGDLLSFADAMEISKAYWNLSATIASRNLSAPYRTADFWRARLAQCKAALLVRCH
jgi:hypothetical protein